MLVIPASLEHTRGRRAAARGRAGRGASRQSSSSWEPTGTEGPCLWEGFCCRDEAGDAKCGAVQKVRARVQERT